MSNPLAAVTRRIRPKRPVPLGDCPVCHGPVHEATNSLAVHGFHVHRGCAGYRMRQRARLR